MIVFLFLINLNLEIYFSQVSGCQKYIIDTIQKTKKSLYVAMYIFTNQEIAQKMAEVKSKKNIEIRVIIDSIYSNVPAIALLRKTGIDVRTINYSKGFMHHKFMIFDRKHLFLGSYNLTVSAEKQNDETCVFIYNAVNIAKAFLKEFQRLWVIGSPQREDVAYYYFWNIMTSSL